MKNDVTIRIKIAEYEFEVCGPKAWAEQQIKKFVTRIRKQQVRNNK